MPSQSSEDECGRSKRSFEEDARQRAGTQYFGSHGRINSITVISHLWNKSRSTRLAIRTITASGIILIGRILLMTRRALVLHDMMFCIRAGILAVFRGNRLGFRCRLHAI